MNPLRSHPSCTLSVRSTRRSSSRADLSLTFDPDERRTTWIFIQLSLTHRSIRSDSRSPPLPVFLLVLYSSNTFVNCLKNILPPVVRAQNLRVRITTCSSPTSTLPSQHSVRSVGYAGPGKRDAERWAKRQNGASPGGGGIGSDGEDPLPWVAMVGTERVREVRKRVDRSLVEARGQIAGSTSS